MHSVFHNFTDWDHETKHMTRVEKTIFFDLYSMYLLNEKPIDASDMALLERRLSCTTEDERKALAFVLKDKFKKAGKYFKRSSWDKILKDYKWSNRNKSNATGNALGNALGNKGNVLGNEQGNTGNNMGNDLSNTLSNAERVAKHKRERKQIIGDLITAGVDVDKKAGIAELRKLHQTHVVIDGNESGNASNAKNAAITSNQEPRTSNHLNTLNNNSAGETDVTKSFDVEVWQPLLADIQPLVTAEAPSMPAMTQVQFDKHLTKFRNLRIEQAAKGNPVVTEARCLDMFVDWIKREYVYEQKSKVSTINAATGERTPPTEYSKIGREPVTNDSDLPAVFHPSHSRPVINTKFDPNNVLIFNGLPKPALPGMTLDETDAYVKHEAKIHGETTDITYERLLNELQEAV